MATAPGADQRAAGDTPATLPRLTVAVVATAAMAVTDRLHALASSDGYNGDGGGSRPDARVGVEDPTLPAAARALRTSMDHLDQLVEALTATDALVAAAMATRVRLLDRARRWSENHAHLLVAATEHGPASGATADQGLARRAVVAELACALRVPERTMNETLVQAEVLVDELPATMAALDAGSIGYPHALVMVDETVGLDAAQVPTLEQQALPTAQTSTVATFRRRARRIRDRLAPGSLTDRRRRASAQRCVDLLPGRDGMATLSHYLPAVQAHAIDHRLTDIARHLQSPTESRTLTQLRADVLTSLLLDDQGRVPSITAAGLAAVRDPHRRRAAGAGRRPILVDPVGTPTYDAPRRAIGSARPSVWSGPDQPHEPPDGGRLITAARCDDPGPAADAVPPPTDPWDLDGLRPLIGAEPPDEDFPPEVPMRSTRSPMEEDAGWSSTDDAGWSPRGDAAGPGATEELWTVPHSLRGIRPTVIVTVPVMTLLGHSDEPGHLHGHGPIDPETARHLAAQAPSFLRLLTHPETGTVLSVGRDRYAVPADLRTWVRLRDETCRFPGCARRAEACDLDHTIAWQDGGSTSCDNLAALCPAHHHLKHDTTWGLSQGPGGVLTFTSPTGRRYTTEPALAIAGAPAPARSRTTAPARTDADIGPATPGHSRTTPRQHRHHAVVPA